MLTIALAAGSTYQTTGSAWQAGNFMATAAQTQLFSTANATANLTGVKLEIGSVATPFSRLPFQQEMARCQRHFEKSYSAGVAIGTLTGSGSDFVYATPGAVTSGGKGVNYQVQKRSSSTVTAYSPTTGAAGKVRDSAGSVDVNFNLNNTGTQGFSWYATTAGSGANFTVQWTADARL
jgi:hypothetical protein